VAIAAGVNHSLALKADGTVVAWGSGESGQIGDGFNLTRKVPTAVVGLSGVSRIAAGWSFSLAQTGTGLTGGRLWAWGQNSSGQLGDGTTLDSNKPLSAISQLATVSAGDNGTLAMALDGGLWAWGYDSHGQLGHGITSGSFQPQPGRVLVLREVLALAGGGYHSVALDSASKVWAWGAGSDGQIGDGANVTRNKPAASGSLVLASNGWLASDTDQDGLSNAAEYRLGTDPLSPDTDLDGLLDGIDIAAGGDAAGPDSDGDGLTNTQETTIGTNSFQTDTDGDGVGDATDCLPLDPTHSSCTSDPNDHTPPTITLAEPPNAVPLP
jgi:hypothetical protein